MVSKCCYCAPLDVGALILGFVTLSISVVLGVYSIVLLGLEHSTPPLGAVHLKLMVHLELDSSSMKIIFSIMLTVELFWMVFSIMLIVGMRKNRPSYLLCYFSFGVLVVILMVISGLLLMLRFHWILSLIQILAAIAFMHGLIVVYRAYELMQNGRSFTERCEDEDQLWYPDDSPESFEEPVAL